MAEEQLPLAIADDEPIENRLASPLDRLAAVVIDFLLFTPIIAVVIAPLRRYALEADLLGQRSSQMHAVGGAAFICACAFILYRSVSHSVWGATVGQRATGVRVVSVWTSDALSFQAASVRAILWCFDLVMIAPLAALFGDSRRRPFHDRAVDSIVISTKGRGVGAPTLPEMSMASGFQAAIWVVTLACAVSTASGKIFGPLLDGTDQLAKNLETEGELCREVGEVNAEGAKNTSRLITALNLYAAELLDESCLAGEADYALWNEESKPLAYLAKAVLEEPGSSSREAYFENACASPEVCDAADSVRLMSEKDEAATDQALAKLSSKSFSFIKISSISKLIDRGEGTRALNLMNEMNPEKKLGVYFARARARALWITNEQSAARATFLAASGLMSQGQRSEFAQWLCESELRSGDCPGAGHDSCNALREAVRQTPALLAVRSMSETFVRADACYGENLTLAHELAASVPEKSGRVMIEALRELSESSESKHESAFKKISEIAEGSRENAFYLMANLKLVEMATRAEDLASIESRWSKSEDLYRRSLGLKLVDRYKTFGSWDRALDIARQIADLDRPDPIVFREIVIGAFRTGQIQLAREFAARIHPHGREPASTDEYSDVLRQLEASP